MGSTQKCSFQKRGPIKRNVIKGTSPSIHNSQLLVSSGIPSFDSLIGGGIPVGSLVLINEDEYGTYAKLMLKYFMAEGIVSKHAVFLASKDSNPDEMINELPAPVDSELEDTNENAESDKMMTIAWRYENLKISSHSTHKHFGHYFDLSRNMDNKTIQNANVELFSVQSGIGKCFEESSYHQLLVSLKNKLEKELYFANQTNPERNILRIALFHLNSPLWQSESDSEVHLLRFMYSLRALIRSAYATCCITLPFSKLKEVLMKKCIHLSDIAIQLQSFAGTKYENTAPYKDYNGFFVIQKLAAINTLNAYNPHISNLAFKLRRKKLAIEAFYLPPELGETTEREQDETSMLSCSSIKSKKLDF